MSEPVSKAAGADISAASAARHLRWRLIKDALVRRAVAVGGVSVIIIITLIFFYLLYVVLPIFRGADLVPAADYPVPGGAGTTTLHLALEEQAEVGLRVTGDGRLVFFDTASGRVRSEVRLPLPGDVAVVALADALPDRATVALGLSDGRALVVAHRYRSSYPDGRRVITPEVAFPLGEEPVPVDPFGRPLTRLAVQAGDERLTLAAPLQDGRAAVISYVKEESFLGEEAAFTRVEQYVDGLTVAPRFVIIDQDQQDLFFASDDGTLFYYDITDPEAPALIERMRLVPPQRRLTALKDLGGGISLLAGADDGRIIQWSLVPQPGGHARLTRIREFETRLQGVTAIAPEHHRKGFLAADAGGRLGIYHTTAHRTLLERALGDGPVTALAVAPRADALLAQDGGRVRFARIHNEHPEISWSALWGKVWYESYPEPMYLWQSSAATSDFEPKFSLVPISFGTLKAAFYAMLLAMPLAIMGAIFTAQFMSPRMRRLVKPSIEVMEALPTVILGFLAGLWLAPFVERHLPGVFALLVIMPPGVLLVAYLWQRLPAGFRHWVPEGWEAALLIPVVMFWGWVALAASPWMEIHWFGGDMRAWLTNEMGIAFDQRNSIVVGLAMGFAVIPTIFSIAEDALFAVPKHLIHGSLALGATPWQTLVRVVLLTASPGIFSAVMIGFGRAVGETMIVLMATGNTPVMDWSIFQGMRTLSANIAVEMPESEVNSTHYRVLFLAALVLFAFTFVVNTAGEVVRQRLRRRYSSL